MKIVAAGGGRALSAVFTCRKNLLLLMTVLSQAFFTLVGGHLVAFSFLSAGHFTLSLEVNIEIYPL